MWADPALAVGGPGVLRKQSEEVNKEQASEQHCTLFLFLFFSF